LQKTPSQCESHTATGSTTTTTTTTATPTLQYGLENTHVNCQPQSGRPAIAAQLQSGHLHEAGHPAGQDVAEGAQTKGRHKVTSEIMAKTNPISNIMRN